jgi:glycosyltransferase involved in cell wall biosynthesis/ADP-heptose:LPS heptosyltransferase
VHKDVGVVCCDYFVIDEAGNIKDVKGKYRLFNSDRKETGWEFMENYFAGKRRAGWPTSMLFRREDFEKVGVFDVKAGVAADIDMWCRILSDSNFYYVDKKLAYNRQFPGNLSKHLSKEGSQYFRAKTLANLKKKQVASSAATGIRGMRLGGLIFSKNRAMQLKATLDSLFLHCRDSKEYDLFVIYRTSSKLHYEQYQQLKEMYPEVSFFEERDFKNQVLQVVKSCEYILFLVDDNIFVRPFSLSDIKSVLATEKQALGFSLRLGANTNYCYSLSSHQKLPQFEEVNAHILRYSWPGQQCDFGYPLEVSSSVYRCADILSLIEQSQFNNPNKLESAVNKGKSFYKSMPYMLTFRSSVAFCNPVNVVQDAYNNKCGTVHSYTAEQLANDFSRGKIIDVKKYIGFTPNAAHQEVPIYYKSTNMNSLIKPANKICADSYNKPKFSVIMANYNNGRYIADAIESMLNQTFSDWELIIIDDCSTDNSLEVIQSYLHDERIRLIQHEVNKGYVSALKTGIENVKSEFFGVLDSDDCLMKEAVEVMYDNHIRYPEFGLIYSQFMYCDENLASKRIGYCAEILSGQTNLESNVVSHFKTFKLCDYLKTTGFNNGILYAEDKDIIYKMEEVTRLKFIDKCLYLYRELPSSQGHDPVKKQIGLLSMENAKLRALNRRNKSQISSSSQEPVDTGFNFLNKSATEYFLRALQEFEKGRFVSAYELMYKYRTTVDYRSLPRFINGEKTKEVYVSVVIVTYNRTEDVKKCIESVEKQYIPREKYEIIVVDNGLTNENVIKLLCDQYIKCPDNLYLSEGRNIGACFARGRIIAFLDDDALVGPDYISSIKSAFDKYDIIGLRGRALPKSNPNANKRAGGYDRGDKPFASFCDLEGSSAFLCKEFLSFEGMDPLLFGHEGLDLTYRIIKKYNMMNKIIYWPETIIYHDIQTGDINEEKKRRYDRIDKYLRFKHNKNIHAIRREIESSSLSEKGSKFSFVMIVLNGMPFIEYSLKSIYDFAYEIIIVEGAVEKCMFAANPDGSSKDGTVEFIKSFPDPAGKIKLIQGKWPEKCEMQNKALKHITGDYVWLIDSDEVYKGEDLEKIRSILKNDPTITQVNFIPDSFWKGLDYIFTSPEFFEPRNHYRRLFKYVPDAVFTTHRPPTMVWPGIDKTTEQMKLLDGTATRRMGVKFYHYSYVLDKQVKQKIELYDRYGWGKSWGLDLGQWYEQCYMKWRPWNRVDIDARYPIWTGDKNSHTEEFKKTHPEVMMDFVLEEAAKPSSSKVMEHVIAALEQLKSSFANEKISVIETGTIRSFYEKHFSTYYISCALGDRGKLISVDISEDSLRVSKQLCRKSTNIEFVHSDSIEYLSSLEKQKFHLAFLDSVNDKDVIFNEFRLLVPMMAEGGIVIIDDAGICPVNHQIDATIPAQKGHRVWEFVRSRGLEAELLTTPCNHGTQLKIEMTADNIHKINAGLCEVVNNMQKVLIVRSDSIGDLVIFGGSFQYYRQLYPDSHISLVVTDAVGNLAEVNPYIDEVITFNRAKIISDQEYAGQFIRRIQTGKYDIAICPAHSRDRVSDFIAVNSGAKKRITTSGDTANQTAEQIEHNNKYFTKILPASDGIKLETFRNEEFLRNLGSKIDGKYAPMAWFTKEDIDFAEKLLEQINVQNPILIAPFAQSPIRDWRLQDWARLISGHRDFPVIICGLEANRADAEKILALTDHPNVHNLCGKTSVRQLAALISKSRLCISPCTAPAHLAAVAGCPHVVIVGGGHFGRFWPYSKLTKMVYRKMDCYGCNWRCQYGDDIKCIKSISLEMVEEAVQSSLGIDSKPEVTQPSEARPDNEVFNYLVSAIVSTYNSEKFIRGCLEDLENQTIADKIEIVVVNSGSEQNEENIVREFQKRYDNIVYIKTRQRECVYSAWNRAIKVAKGKYLTNANTDDRHRRDALEILSNELMNNPEIALVYADQICTETPNATFEKHDAVEMHQQPDYTRERLLQGCCVGSQPMWRSSLHKEFGYFDENLDCAGDWDFWLRVSEKCTFKRVPEFLGLYYFNREGIEHGNMFHSYYERYAVGKRYGTEYISTFNTYQTKRNWLVSVILPAYNAEKYIGQAIESVLIQNYRHFELVIINDGSTDRTEEIIQSYKDEHIRYFKQANRGLAVTHNEGIRQSRGEFLIKVDADDFIAVDFVGRHLNVFYNHRDADLVYCDDYLVEEDGKPIRIIERPEYANRRILIRDLFRAGFPVVPFRTCINRRVFEKIGLFDESLRIGEDYDMMRRFVKAGLKAQHLKAALYYRRMTSESLSRQYSISKARAHFGIVKSYAETFSHDELFPGVRWELIPYGMRQLHFKCLVAMNFISLGRTYIETNLPSYARAALESAGEQLRNCLEIDPGNDNVKKLIDRCRQLEENLPQDVLINV